MSPDHRAHCASASSLFFRVISVEPRKRARRSLDVGGPWPQAFGRRVTEDGADVELGSPARGRSPREGESNAAIRDSLRLSVPE